MSSIDFAIIAISPLPREAMSKHIVVTQAFKDSIGIWVRILLGNYDETFSNRM